MLLEPRHAGDGFGHVVQQQRFGQLQLQPGRIGTAPFQQLEHPLDEIVLVQQVCTEVDRETEMGEFRRFGPARQLCAGLGQHLLIEGVDQTGVFGLGDECRWSEQTAQRVLPAHQRLGANDAFGLLHLRLEIEYEFAVLQAQANLFLQTQPFLHGQLHARVEEAQGVLAGNLRFVHRHVGALHQLVAAAGFGTEQHHADTGAAVQREIGQAIRPIQRVQQLHADVLGLARRA